MKLAPPGSGVHTRPLRKSAQNRPVHSFSFWSGLAVLLMIGSFPTARAAADQPGISPDMRDFPPLVEPGRKAPAPAPAVPPGQVPSEVKKPAEEEIPSVLTPAVPAAEAAPAAYRLGVGDGLEILVLGQPDYSKTVKVRPDGAITAPAAGTVFALGRTPEEVGQEIQEKLATYIRHAVVNLMVSDFGDQKVFVLGEVALPGERTFYKGMSVIQALAQAGGLKPSGKAGNVVVLRRTGADEARFMTVDVADALKNKPGGSDMALRPFDIVYVPRSFIGDVNVFVDQYFRQNIAPFTLYLEGWNAFNIAQKGVRIITTQ
jgi:protein involved in polysaccharide export with SLBB domain